ARKKAAAGDPRRLWQQKIVKRCSVLGRPGSDLLFQVLRLSTIGAGKFNGRVRDGIGFRLPANTTRPAKDGQRRSHDRDGQRLVLSRTSAQAGRYWVRHWSCDLCRPMGIEDERDQVRTSD